jgi:hypothetical protein
VIVLLISVIASISIPFVRIWLDSADDVDAFSNSVEASLETKQGFNLGISDPAGASAVQRVGPSVAQLGISPISNGSRGIVRIEYLLQEPSTKANFVLLAPPGLAMDDFGFDCKGGAESCDSPDFKQEAKAHVSATANGSRLDIPISLSPRLSAGLFVTYNIRFSWVNSNTRKIGFGRQQCMFSVGYQGPDVTNFTPLTALNLTAIPNQWFLSGPLERIGTDLNEPYYVVYSYFKQSSIQYMDVSPVAESNGALQRAWTVSKSHPTLFADLAIEDSTLRSLMDLLTNIIFLFLGAVIGTALARYWV